MNLSLDLLDEIVDLAYQAGHEILKIYQKAEPSIQKKSDHSPVTEADLLADTIIQSGLGRLTNEPSVIPIITEESITNTEEALKIVTTPGFSWVVDPLDGTRDFIAKTGDFAVCISLIHSGVPVLGVVHCPWHQITLGAVQGLGALSFQNSVEHGTRGLLHKTAIRCRPFEAGPPTLLVSRFHSPRLQDKLRLFFPTCDLKVAGSAYKYCLIALGQADLSLRRSPTSLWDIAAAQCILTEAGGGIIDFEGEPLTYNHGSLINPPLIAHGILHNKQGFLQSLGAMIG